MADPEGLVHEVLAQVPEALSQVDQLLPKGFPGRVSDPIFAGIERQARILGTG
ncbi:MAG: hypothetical protein Q8N18_00230 [Opitutaceae bacterium]|nr:hypothetical protein [Opitutaceae bacterium]